MAEEAKTTSKSALLAGAGSLAPRLSKYEDVVMGVAWAHMIDCTFALLQKRQEIEVNPGMKEAAEGACRPLLQGLDEFTVSMICRRAAGIGDRVMRRIDAPNEVTRCLALAYGVGLMVSQGAIDSEGTLAAIATGLVLESEDENDEVWSNAKSPKPLANDVLRYFFDEFGKP